MSSSSEISAAFYRQLGAAGLAARTAPAWDEQILARLRELLRPGERILDVGCGYGRIAIPLALAGFDVTGLDLSDDLLQAARQQADEASAAVRWVRASMCRMPLASGSFHVALCLWSAFYELLEVEAQLEAVREMYRVLRPGGWCLIEGPLFKPASAEEISAGSRTGPENHVSLDVVGGLPNPHFCHDETSLARLMQQAAIEHYSIFEESWAGRPRQLLRFVKSS